MNEYQQAILDLCEREGIPGELLGGVTSAEAFDDWMGDRFARAKERQDADAAALRRALRQALAELMPNDVTAELPAILAEGDWPGKERS
jgi:hypothetical protein